MDEEEDRRLRIQARRDRIARANKADDSDDAANAQESYRQSEGKQRIADALAILDSKKAKTIDKVTAIRVEVDSRENERRIEEEDRRQDRLWRLQEEAVASGKANAAVEMRWNDLMQYNMPQDLHREIEAQKAACKAIIRSKDQLIREFQAELKAKDEEYVKALQQQREDIEELVNRMTEQYNELRDSYDIELTAIEDAFIKERKELLDRNRRELEDLFKRREDMEAHFFEDRLATESKYQQEIEDMMAKDAEDYNKLKIRLENDIQILERQLEHMRAVYLLNTQKLNYNFRLLTEKDVENQNTKDAQAQKFARLRDALQKIIQKYQTTDAKYKKANAELTKDYKRLTRQYNELQEKFKHFEAADAEKFQEVWAMHEEEVSVMVDRLLAADRVIHEQLLGWEWKPPSKDVRGGGTVGPQATSASSRASTEGPSSRMGGDTPGFSATRSKTLASPGQSAQEAAGATPAPDALSDALEAQKEKERQERVRRMLRLIVQECDFLIDDALRRECEMMTPGESEVAKADAILKSIGVEGEEDIAVLLSYFYDEDTGSELLEEGDGDDGDDGDATELGNVRPRVGPEGVVRAVKQFVEEREAARREAAAAEDPFGAEAAGGGGGGAGASSASASVGAGQTSEALKKLRKHTNSREQTSRQSGQMTKASLDDTLGRKRGGEPRTETLKGGVMAELMDNLSVNSAETERARARKEEGEYWRRLADVVPERTIRVWKALEKGLHKYNNILRERVDLVDEIKALKQQNDELRQALVGYIQAPVNDDLIIPPTKTIRMKPETLQLKGSGY